MNYASYSKHLSCLKKNKEDCPVSQTEGDYSCNLSIVTSSSSLPVDKSASELIE